MELDIEHGRFHGEFTGTRRSGPMRTMQLFGQSTEPVCWMQLGYASGYSSALMGCFIHYRETQCAAAGAPCCPSPAGRAQVARRRSRAALLPAGSGDRPHPRAAGLQSLRYAIDHDLHTDDLVGHLARLQTGGLAAQARGAQPVTVLLQGETGVGKELFARAAT